MKWAEAEKQLSTDLNKIYSTGEASSIAALAMEAITGAAKNLRLVKKNLLLTPEQNRLLAMCTHRLLDNEPVQYILNKAHFYGMELYVDTAVLIPRPETEELVQWIIGDVKESGKDVFIRNESEADATTELKIIDVGTGSGCIALALKKAMPKAEVWGCDVSEAALNVARRNGAALDVRVDFQAIDFLVEAQQKLLPTVDIIVSNPPYIPEKDKTTMQANVLNYEPHNALFVPNDDALIFYRSIAHFAQEKLHEAGSIYLEIHEDLANAVVALFAGNGYKNIEVKKDMQDKERMVRVRF
ncbi:MAG: peptide chain release factor N(5)-glutamine methyltransferase [Bacteroidota bacterium]